MSQMDQIAEQEAPEPRGAPELPARYVIPTDPFLVVCKCFSVVTVVSAIMCVVVNVFSAVRSFETGANVFAGILRCYAVIIALFVAVAETEWERILKFWRVLGYWVGRGMLQIFVAVMTKALSNATANKAIVVILEDISSYMLLACGVLYVISGLLCIGRLKHARAKKAISREQAARDLEELEKRRSELRGLLIDRT